MGGVLDPQNLFYELPLLLAVVLTLIQLIGGLEAGHNLHVGLDHDVGHDVSHDVGHEAGYETGHDHALEHEQTQSGTRDFSKILGFLGIGRAPIFLVLAAFCYSWAFVGFACVRLFSLWLPAWLYVWPAISVTIVLTVFSTRYIARGLSFFFRTENYGITMHDLIGSEAITRIRVSHEFGTAELHDRFGNLQVVQCRIPADSEIIPAGTTIVLYQWYPERGVFQVIIQDQWNDLQSVKPLQ